MAPGRDEFISRRGPHFLRRQNADRNHRVGTMQANLPCQLAACGLSSVTDLGKNSRTETVAAWRLQAGCSSLASSCCWAPNGNTQSVTPSSVSTRPSCPPTCTTPLAMQGGAVSATGTGDEPNAIARIGG